MGLLGISPYNVMENYEKKVKEEVLSNAQSRLHLPTQRGSIMCTI